nr:class II aldolase/adducin family protein [Bacillus sp. sid0103]
MTNKMVLSYHPPVFSTMDEEREHLKQRLAASFRLFSKFGFDEGVAGYITARDPEFKDHFWVTRSGCILAKLRPLT